MLSLIDDILDLSKIEAGKFVVNMADININSVVEGCVELVKPLSNNRGIKLFNHFVENKPYVVKADGFRIKQVLLNLLSNAVKYNHADGTVSISGEVTASHRLRVSITDSGVGISEDDQQKVFEPFERIHSESGVVEGTGIGLVITKNLVEMMGGTIGVESYKYIGSTFWIELDLVEMEGGSSVDVESFERRTESADAIQVSETAMQGKKILYIEDEPANLRLVQQLVNRLSSASLISAANGALGIEIAKKELPDLILLDVNLPGMDGYQVATRLKRLQATAGIPIVGLSANALQEDIDRGCEVGFVEYLTKPINVELLMDVLQKRLGEPNGKPH